MIRSLVIGLITLGIISCHTSQKNKIGLGEINAFQYQSPKTLVVDNAAVVTAHPLASKIGLAVLQQGGNAFDAAIATQLALAVVYSQTCNLGVV